MEEQMMTQDKLIEVPDGAIWLLTKLKTYIAERGGSEEHISNNEYYRRAGMYEIYRHAKKMCGIQGEEKK